MPRIHFHLQLTELKDLLMAEAALAQQAVETAVEAYLERSKRLCKYVKRTESAINTAQRDLDGMAYELLAKEQPMAIDLRFIFSVIKINSDLERIGDQAMGIARRTKNMLNREQVELPVDFALMGENVTNMIRSAVQALLEEDVKLAEEVRAMDDEIDRMHEAAVEALLKTIQENPHATQQAMAAMLVSKNLERIADHASNIATDVIFWIRGADLRHEEALAADLTQQEQR